MALPGATSPPESPSSKNHNASTAAAASTASTATATATASGSGSSGASSSEGAVPLRSLMTNAAAKKNWRLSFTISAGYKVS
jgi:hypothetical protein